MRLKDLSPGDRFRLGRDIYIFVQYNAYRGVVTYVHEETGQVVKTTAIFQSVEILTSSHE
jgi:hypothetical protein